MINFNAAMLGIQAIQPVKKREDNSYLTNTIAPQAPQEMPKAKVSPDLAQVVFGVQHNFGAKKNGGDEVSKWVNNLPFAKDLAPEDRRNLAAVVRKGDEETDYMKKMIHLVCKDMVTPQATATLCKHGVMSDFAKRDIDTYYDKVKEQGMSVKDAFVPEFATKAEAEKVTPVGDVFRVAGQERIFVKSDDAKSQQLKMDADTFLKIYPPVERFAACQGGNGDCYLLSTINSIMENPYTRATLFGCFEQNGNDVTVKLPNGKAETKFEGGRMPLSTDMEKFTEGPLGMKMLEKAYGVEVEQQTYDKYTKTVNKEFAKMEKELAKWEKKNPNDALTIKKKKEINQRIENWKIGQAKVDEAMKDPNHKLLILTDDYDELIIGKFGPMTEDVSKVDPDYKFPTDYYTGGIGGFIDVAAINFGFPSKDFMVGEDDKEIDKALLAKNPHDYIITAGTYPEEEGGMESPQEKSYSIYSSHAYKILPFDDEKGNRMFKVTNPWNQSHAVIMDIDHVKEFFQDIAITKVHNSEENANKKAA